jgi:hypothetical protein
MEDGGCFEPSPWAIYQNDLCGYDDKPRWFPSYDKLSRSLVQKIKAFSWGDPIPMTDLQTSININIIMKITITDQKLKQDLLSFVLLRNLIRL